MKLNDCSFRDINQKWIVFNKWRDIKKINKFLKSEFEDGLLMGYVFIDHEKGLMVKIVGNIIIENNNSLTIDDKYINDDLIIDSDLFSKLKFTILDKNIEDSINNTTVIEEIISNKYYQKQSLLKIRDAEEFDEFRNNLFPDDLELCLEKDKKSELLWGRVEDCSKDSDILICRLLDSSKLKPNYKEDELIMAKVVKDKKNIDIIIESLVNKKSQ